MEFPITAAELSTFTGGLVIALVIGLWAKRFLPDWRLTPLAVLVGTVAVVLLANWGIRGPAMARPDWVVVTFWGIFAATAETFGYETIQNARGLMGQGRRSDEGLDEEAIERMATRELGG